MSIIKSHFDILDLSVDWWFDSSRTDRMNIDGSNRMQQYVMLAGSGQLSQGTANFRAALVSGPANRSVLSFNGSNNRYNFNFSDALPGDWEITCVFKATAGPVKTMYCIRNGVLAGFSLFQVGVSGQLISQLGGSSLSSVDIVDDGEYHVGSFRYNGTTSLLRIYVDGDFQVSGNRGNDATTGNWRMGTNKDSNSEFFIGEIAEGFKLSEQTPDDTFNAYQQHLCDKWKIEYKG